MKIYQKKIGAKKDLSELTTEDKIAFKKLSRGANDSGELEINNLIHIFSLSVNSKLGKLIFVSINWIRVLEVSFNKRSASLFDGLSSWIADKVSGEEPGEEPGEERGEVGP